MGDHCLQRRFNQIWLKFAKVVDRVNRPSYRDRVNFCFDDFDPLFANFSIKRFWHALVTGWLRRLLTGTIRIVSRTQRVRRTVALKLIRRGMDTKDVIARFESERQALSLMNHPNVAKVLDADRNV